MQLVPHSGGELRKELTCEVVRVVRVACILAAQKVVEDSTIGRFVNMRQAEIHVVAFDGAGHATDEDHGAIRLLPFDDPDVRERVVYLPVTIIVPCIVEEDKITGVGNRSPMESALLSDVSMNDPDAVGMMVNRISVIQINAMSEKHRTGDPCAIIGNGPAVAFNRSCAHQCRCRPHNCAPTWCVLHRPAAGRGCRWRWARAFD
jgi:hypothetical protein